MLIDIETASPPYLVTQEKAAAELKKRMTGSNAASRLIDIAALHSGIDQRSIVIPDADTDADGKFYSANGSYISPDTRQRMSEYENWSKILTRSAVKKILEKTDLQPSELK